jgi:hypothetical protein
MPNPLTGYDPSRGDASGKGGRARESSVMSQVDAAANGPKSAQSPTSQGGPTQAAKAHPAASSYAPSNNSGDPAYAPANQGAVASHVYGSPIEGNGPSK